MLARGKLGLHGIKQKKKKGLVYLCLNWGFFFFVFILLPASTISRFLAAAVGLLTLLINIETSFCPSWNG